MRRFTVLVALTLVPAVAFGGFRVSSFKKETRLGANHWNAAAALDGDPATCWMVNPENDNQGSWFEVDIPKSTVDKLEMIVGWDASEAEFLDYARVKTVKVEVFDEGSGDEERVLEHSVTFEDQRGSQVIDLPDTKVGNEIFGGKVRLTIQEVYPGKDYPNLAVSEVLVHLGEMDAPARLLQPPESVASGHGAENLVDENNSTFWASEGSGMGQTFEVGADGFGVSNVGLLAGPKTHARPRTIEVIANDMTRTYVMEDSTEMQWFRVPPIIGYTGSGWGDVRVKVVDTYPGTQEGVAVSEVKLRATNYGGL